MFFVYVGSFILYGLEDKSDLPNTDYSIPFTFMQNSELLVIPLSHIPPDDSAEYAGWVSG